MVRTLCRPHEGGDDVIDHVVVSWGNLVAFRQRIARVVAQRRRPTTVCWHIWHHCAILVASVHNRGRSCPGGDGLAMRIGQHGQQRLDIVTAKGAHSGGVVDRR